MSSTDYYLLGLLNSTTLWYYLINIAAGRNGGYIEAKPIYVSQLPVKIIKSDNPTENTLKNEIIRNVEYLLQLNKEKQSATLQSQIDQIQSRIDYYEDKINLAVYQLYGLTQEEIKIVEDSIKK
jgi:hypothetical protein